jgi:hypothetical protein
VRDADNGMEGIKLRIACAVCDLKVPMKVGKGGAIENEVKIELSLVGLEVQVTAFWEFTIVGVRHVRPAMTALS